MPTANTITLVSWALMVLVGITAVIFVVPQLRKTVLHWLHSKFNGDFTPKEQDPAAAGYDPTAEDFSHRILVYKDEEGGGMVPGEGWRNAVRTAIILGVPEVILLATATLVLPSWWKLLGIGIFGAIIVVSIGIWVSCFEVVKERQVGLIFRKGHLYGFLRPGWYLVARPFGFETLPWKVDRNRRETWDLEAKKILTADDLQIGFDPVLTMENMDLHTHSPTQIRHPDSTTHPATDDEEKKDGLGKILVEKGQILPWNLQSPYLRVFRYQMDEVTGQQELGEEIRKAVDTIAFLYCISSTWIELKEMFSRPSQTIPKTESIELIKVAMEKAKEAAPSESEDNGTTPREKTDRDFASLQQLIRNYLEKPLFEGGIRIVDVRIKNIVPPAALLDTKTAELRGESELRRMRKVTEALEVLGNLAGTPAADFFLTEKSIEAYTVAAGKAGSVVITTPPDTLRRLEINTGSS
ncbi:hypothetical protein KKB10_03630 [Patescibacteria group bacterium]|nr:hypothetical protein [Patescibacteria group bacterium]MBU1074895.1 hypothetical protein [Patescibacteria group bacterium]MBU1952071.1 hypothetical protein [Patescibacteria group bacterium]